MTKTFHMLVSLIAASLFGCEPKKNSQNKEVVDSVMVTENSVDTLPKPYATESVKNFSKVIGWEDDQKPVAPEGFTVTKFADKLDNPRWIYVAPNGDIFVAESNTESKGEEKVAAELSGKAESQNLGNSANRITLFRDTNKDGKQDVRKVFLKDLTQPFGMLIMGNNFYVANTDGIIQFPYNEGQTEITTSGNKILELPKGGYNNHWTRNIIANADSSKIYVSVGSASNNAEYGMEEERRRANILEINPDGTGERIFASGLRNPVGMDIEPKTQTLWTAVNERDDLGDELVPDYITSVKEGGFYGWPYAYFGIEDPRMKGQHPELVKETIIPEVGLDAHSASLGLAFYDKEAFPEKFRGGAFIGQHGSWNRSELVGYKVIFVPFTDGKPSGEEEDFLTGFVANKDKNEVHGRPVGVTVIPDGSLLVADDASNTIWRVSYGK